MNYINTRVLLIMNYNNNRYLGIIFWMETIFFFHMIFY